MKLHLPKLLRNSVLACITAVAGIVTTTVGTATFAGGVVAFTLASHQAQAAELTVLATMSDLVSSGTIGSGVTDISREGYTAYSFDGTGAITGISHEGLATALAERSGCITIAAWVKTATEAGKKSILSYGGALKGLNFVVDGEALGYTNKSVTDLNPVDSVKAGEWSLVALTLNLGSSANSKLYVGETATYTRDLTYTAPATAQFGIGTFACDGLTDAFVGEIANLTIFTSTEVATNADIVNLLGSTTPVPDSTYYWDVAAENNAWNSTSWVSLGVSANWVDGSDVCFAGAGEEVTIGQDVTAKRVTVDGAGWVWSGENKVTVTGDLIIGATTEGSSLSIATTVGGDNPNVVNGKVNVASGSELILNAGTTTFNGAVSAASGSELILNGGRMNFYGGIDIQDRVVVNSGSNLWIGQNENSNNSIRISNLHINAGGTVHLNHAEAQCLNTNVTLNGGELKAHDMGTGHVMAFGELNLQGTGTSRLNFGYNGGLSFERLTGTGHLELDGADDPAGQSIELKSVENFAGSITGWNDLDVFKVGTILAEKGITTTIGFDFESANFAKTGDGALVINANVSASGVLNMNYEGSLTMGEGKAITVAEGTKLVYTGVNDKVLYLDTLTTAVTVELQDVNSAVLTSGNGVNLGIKLEAGKEAELRELLNIDKIGDSCTITSIDNVAWVKFVGELSTEWDANWGVFGLAHAADGLTASSVVWDQLNSADQGLFANGYYDETNKRVAVKLGENNADASNYKGAVDSPVGIVGAHYTGKTGAGQTVSIDNGVWIYAEDGMYGVIVGGCMAGNWNNKSASTVIADSHIIINNAGDASSPLTVVNVLGGNLADCADEGANRALFDGDTYVSVYTDSVQCAVVGGSMTVHGGGTLLTGDTHVYVYTPLSNTANSAYRTEEYAVVGGIMAADKRDGSTSVNAMTGDSHVVVDLTQSTSTNAFAKKIIGGSVVYGTCSQDGGTSVNIKGDNASNSDITFADVVVGGAYLAGGSRSTVGDSAMTINGGSYNARVSGGTYANGSNANVTQGSVSTTITDASFAQEVVGGVFVGGFNSTATVGDVKIVLDGVSLGTDLFGGVYHYANQNGASTSTVGDVRIELTGDGSVSGNIWAAGGTRHNSANITVASTTVTIDGTVSILDGSRISGGFKTNSDTTPNVSVSGGRTLVFNGAQNNSRVTFADFDTIKVTAAENAAAANATIGALTSSTAVTKTGAGILTLAGSTYALAQGLTVSEGTLATSGATMLGGALTLANGTGLNVRGGVLTLATGEGAALNLGTGLALTLSEIPSSGDITLISGVGSVTGITGTVAASTIFNTINGHAQSTFEDYTLKVENGNLILTALVPEPKSWLQIADEPGGIWQNEQAFGDTGAVVFKNRDSAYFGTADQALAYSEEVTVNGSIIAGSVYINAGTTTTGEGESATTENNVITFKAGTDADISTGILEVASGTARFESGILDLNQLEELTVNGRLEVDMKVTSTEADPQLNGVLSLLSGAEGTGTLVLRHGGWACHGNYELQTVGLEVDGNLELSNWDKDWELATLVVDNAVKVTGDAYLARSYKVTVQNDGSFTTEGNIIFGNSVGTATLEMTNGSVTTAGMTRHTECTKSENAFIMSGGTLEITSATGIASSIAATITGGTLKATGDVSWSMVGAKVGGATITTGTGAITLNNAKLTDKLTVSAGTLILTGEIDINPTGGFDAKVVGDPCYYTVGATEPNKTDGNGFRYTTVQYTLADGAGKLDVSGVTTWKIDGVEKVAPTGYSYADKVLTANTADGTLYWVNTGTVNYGAIGTEDSGGYVPATDMTGATGLALNGGVLQLNTTLQSDWDIERKGIGTINLNGTDVTLTAEQVTGTGSATLTGTGVYDLGSSVTPKVANLTASAWAGTVSLTNARNVSGDNLNALGNAASTISLSGVTVSLGSAKTYAASIELRNVDGTPAITHNGGANEQKFTGSVSGDGSFVWASGTSNEIIHFAGDVSGWNGEFVKQSTQAIYLTFSGSDEINATLTRETGSVGSLFIKIDDENLATAGSEIVLNSTIKSGDNLPSARTKLTITADTKVKIAGNVTVADFDNSGVVTVDAAGSMSITRDMTNSGSYTTGKDLTVAGTFNNTGSYTSTAGLTLAGAASGTGSLDVTSLTLQAASNVVGDLTLSGALTLGVAAEKTADGVITTAGVASTLETTGQLSVTGDVKVLTLGAGITETSNDGVTTSYGMLKAAGLAGKLNFVIAEEELTRYMGTSNTLTLATITGLTTEAVSLNKVAENTQWSDTDHAWTDSEGQYTYALSVDTNGTLTLTRENMGIIWAGEEGEKWVMDDASDAVTDTKAWTNKVGSEELVYTKAESVILDGRGIPDVVISGNVETKNVNIIAEGETDTYTFKGDAANDLNTLDIQNKLSVLKGTLKAGAGLNVYAMHSVEVLNGAALELLSGASVHALAGISNAGTVTIGAANKTQGAAALYVEDEGSVNNSGTMEVNGMLQAGYGMGVAANGSNINNSGTLTNAGMIKADGNLDNSGIYTQTAGSLTVYGNVLNTGSVTETTPAGGMNITDGYAVVGGNLTNSGAMSISGGAQTRPGEEVENVDCVNLEVGGTLTNTSTLVVSGEGTSVTAGQLANSGAVTIDAAELQVLGQPVLTYSNVEVTDPVTGEVVTEPAWEVKRDPETGDPMFDENGGFVMEEIQVPVTELRGAIADGTVAASYSNDGGELNITNGGQLVVSAITDDFDGYLAGVVTNAGGIINIRGALEQQVNEEGEPVLDDAGKPVMVPNTGMLVEGDLDNTEGIINVGSETTCGSLTVTGDLINTNGELTIAGEGSSASIGGDLKMVDVTGEGENETIANAGNLTVGEGASLSVGGDLVANQLELGFDGSVTVGGSATAEDIIIAKGGSFTAENATITGTLANDGVFSVTTTEVKDDNGNVTYTGGQLSIGTLTGAGEVHVEEGGTLSIGSSVNFTGTLTGEGKLTTGNQAFTLLTKQDEVKDVALATDISAKSLVVAGQWMKDGEVVTEGTEGATWASANGSILGEVATDSITFTKLDTTGNTHLTMESLQAYSTSTASGVTQVEVALSQLDTEEGVAELIKTGVHTYNLLSYVDGKVNFSLADMAYDREQQLWKSGLKLGEIESASTMALRAASTNVSISVLEQTMAEATWNTAGETTGIGLDLGTLTNGTMVLKGNDMLDNVQSVNVTKDVTLDLSSNDTNAVNVNGLSGEKNLTISGNGDTVNVTTAVKQDDGTTTAGEYTGVLNLKGVTADMDLKGTTVVAEDDTVVLKGTIEDGMLEVQQDSAAQGDGLELNDTTLRVVIDSDFNTLDDATLAGLENSIVNVGGTETDGDIEIGTYNADGDFIASAGYAKYFDMSTIFIDPNGNVVADRNTSYFSDNFTAESANGEAGMTLADAALLKLNPQMDKDSELGAMLTAIENAGSTTARDELAASLAGASSAVLGMAVSGDVDRQLRAIRNRTTTMGVDQSVANEDMPYFNAWINAEGSMNELSDNGTEGGYKLNSWGGTVGFDVDICPTFTAGMAFTAMYGDLDVTGADTATGDLDTYYLSAFARYSESAWTHTFVATVGTGDISLKRTVLGSEQKVETDALSFGLMYEVGRVFALDEDGSACLQPVFNVTWKHTTVDGYTEDGSDLALKVDEQTVDTVTFGLGARLQAVVGESMYNRTSIFEARVLAKADVGDRNGSADVALASLPGSKAEVESAEMGAFGLEAGAGLTIPVGEEGGSIFMDASVELRSDYTDVNGTVGYRINF